MCLCFYFFSPLVQLVTLIIYRSKFLFSNCKNN
nr:MAG TPA: hypothetical protein [Caudoviricetes sp.]DAS95304.1 MAG TPA: hypothetical protein [Caudoviricetes sp.]